MFQKYPNNPIFGNPSLGTLFDVYLTALPDGRFRMDLSTRKDNALSVSFSEDGIHAHARHSLRLGGLGQPQLRIENR